MFLWSMDAKGESRTGTKSAYPSCWSTKHKFPSLSLTNGNIRVRVRGRAAQMPASIRSDRPIPVTCGIYYFEVRIVDKGREGRINIGLCTDRSPLDHLPGWTEGSFGYCGENGKIYAGSESGVAYGPTFTSGDVIGCAFNCADRTCFYTKNGHNIGIAFRNVEGKRYYTAVGLFTTGETVEANFGQNPFIYDITDEIKDLSTRVHSSVLNHRLPLFKSEWFHSLISNYLVHYGFCATAQSFSMDCAQNVQTAMKRRDVLDLVKSKQFESAQEKIRQYYPRLFEQRPETLLALKCLQFLSICIDCETHFKDDTSFQNHSKSILPGEAVSTDVIFQSSSKYHQRQVKSFSSSPKLQKNHGPIRRSDSPSINMIQNGYDDSHHSSSSEYFDPPTSAENGTAIPSGDCESGMGFPENDEQTNHHEQSMVDGAKNGSTVYYDAPLCTENGNLDGNSNDAMDDYLMMDCTYNDSTDDKEYLPRSSLEHLVSQGRKLKKTLNELKEKRTIDKSVLSECATILHNAFKTIGCPNSTGHIQHWYEQHGEQILLLLNSTLHGIDGGSSNNKSSLEILYAHAQRLRVQMASHEIAKSAFIDPDIFVTGSGL